MLTPTQRRRLLALPIEARRKLAEQRSDGRLIDPDGVVNKLQRWPFNVLRMDGYLSDGYAWAPSNDTAWMEAATPEGGWWEATVYDELTWSIYSPPSGAPDDAGDIVASANTAIDCALAALEATTRKDP